MIPDENYDDFEDVDDEEQDIVIESDPSLTYAMKMAEEENTDNTFIGRVDEEDAIRQAIIKIINTERYEHEIYSDDYGIELQDLFGQPIPYVMSEVQDRIKEAVEADDRIESADEFDIQRIDKRKLFVSFTVTLDQTGEEIDVESEVEY